MSDEPIRVYFQTIRRKITAFLSGDQTALPELNTALEDLQSLYEQMQTNLEVAEITAESWLEENQYIASSCQHYYDLFQLSPIAYLVTNAAGIIQEANQATAQLLNTLQDDLAGQPLILYVTERDRLNFRLKLSQLRQKQGVQVWQLMLCPQIDQPFTAELSIVPIRNHAGELEELRVAVYNVTHFQRKVNQLLQQQIMAEIRVREDRAEDRSTQEPPTEAPEPPSTEMHSRVSRDQNNPATTAPALAELKVLIVDDEVSIHEFVTAMLEPYGIQVHAVTSAAAALAALEHFCPDLLLSDLRLPNQDGYSLIQQIRAIEAKQGGHLPAAAITAYLDEEREKVFQAGFEACLHKFAQPQEWIEAIVQLAQSSHRSA